MTIYHFVGIKGSGMSALAQILHDKGYEIQGSDIEKFIFTQVPLEKANIPILPFNRKNIKPGMKVIAGNAFPDSHEEIAEAREQGIPVIRYHDFLGMISNQFTDIAITGSHGKTSTTGLLAHVIGGAKPTSFLIGDGTGHGEKDADYFVFEACEYRRHFLAYHPDYVIMTNIDFDHPDYFSDIDDVFSAFQQMAKQVKKAIIAYGDDEQLQKIQADVPVIYYGFREENDFHAQNIKTTPNGTTFDVYIRNDFFTNIKIPSFGDHNVLNALAVIATCHYENIDVQVIKKQMLTFKGVKRRFTEKEIGEQILVDDYAHHPVEIQATIRAAQKKYPDREIVAVFQPHTFTRTQTFLQDFADSLSEADQVYLCDIFGSARENHGKLTIDDLRGKIDGAEIMKEDDTSALLTHDKAVILFMGAGDIQKFQTAYENLLQLKKAQ